MTDSPFPNTTAITARLNAHFAALAADPIEVPDDGTLYGIENAFGTVCDSWKGMMQPDRFGRTTDTNILYRSQIIDELFAMVDTILLSPNMGMMVKGPQGIGKSHTLVNLVLKLQSTGNYLVTFVPDCNKFKSGHFFLKVICDSFGIDVYGTEGLGFPKQLSAFQHADAIELALDAIADCLQSTSKMWVFVFDQINRIFASQPGAQSFNNLGYPYSYIRQVMRPGVISIISASANNEIAYVENHVGFRACNHVIEMSDDELEILFHDELTSTTSITLETVRKVAAAFHNM
jgi:hypothetical protein